MIYFLKMFTLLFALCVSVSCSAHELTPKITPGLTPDTRGLVDDFENLCDNETLYKSDKVLSVICPMFHQFKEHVNDTDDDSKIGSIISLCFEVLSFLIGAFGVSYFVYLRCKTRFSSTIDKPNDEVELEIQKI